MTKFAKCLLAVILIQLISGVNTYANNKPTESNLQQAVKHINKLKVKDNYGFNYKIDQSLREIRYYDANFSGSNRQDCLVVLPCVDDEAPRLAGELDFVVLFYKDKSNNWAFSKDYLEVNSIDTLDFERDGVVEIITDIGWTQNGEKGDIKRVYSLKNEKFKQLFSRESTDLEGLILAPDDLKMDKKHLYELDYKDVNHDGKIDIIETYKIGKVVKFENENPIFKYKTTVTNYIFKNGKFVKEKLRKSNKKK